MRLSGDLDGSITFIDEKFEDIIMRIDTLQQAVKWQLCRYAIDKTIFFLEDYSAVHLRKEERHMRRYGYPLYLSHKERHDRFAAQMLDLKEELLKIRSSGSGGSYELSVRTIQAAVDWLNEHVRQDDCKLADFLRNSRTGAAQES